MGFDKMFATLGDRKVIEHSIDAFSLCTAVQEIIVVINPQTSEKLRALLHSHDDEKIIKITNGGDSRRDSVSNGLKELATDCDYVAVHDGARAWITPEQINRVFDAAVQHGAAASAHPVTDTVKRTDPQGIVIESVNRELLWSMETPQIFQTKVLKKAYERIMTSGTEVTDEVSAVEQIGEPVHLITNTAHNVKITIPDDLKLPPPHRHQ